MAACSSSSDDNPPMAMDDPPPPVVDPAPDPVLTELEMAQADAAAAATAAMTASGEAETAAMAAMAAVANLATMQTGATAGGLAYEAHTAAGKAMMAYMDAKAASEAAAEAEEVTAAVEDRIMAEEAMADAVKYATMASEKGADAETAAMAELMIDGKDKNVGGTSLNADDGSSNVTTNGVSVITGRMKGSDPMHKVAAVPGVAYNLGADTPHTQAVAEHDFSIGRTLDTSDDMARLMLVTHYAGSKSVKVYADLSGTDLVGSPASDGRIQTMGVGTEDTEDDVFFTLKSVGSYYLAGAADADDGLSAEEDLVADGAKAKEVFSYVDASDATVHVVLRTTSVTGTVTTLTYTPVGITVAAATADDDAAVSEVTASIPEATEYKHIHFGVWAALGAAEKDGSHEPSDLGIGFVQSIGDGLTGADMPNNGTANFSGNWAAAVQKADEDGNGDISLLSGVAGVTANFSKATINVDLTGLAALEGAIDTNTFSGTKATVDAANTTHNLDSTGKFTGSFSGGFYGAKAAEAGGVFDFTSEDAEAGAFRGAFGGDRK